MQKYKSVGQFPTLFRYRQTEVFNYQQTKNANAISIRRKSVKKFEIK